MRRPVLILGAAAALPLLVAARKPPPLRLAAPPAGTSCELGLIDRTRTTSGLCLACHDGSVTAPTIRDGGGSGTHPVDLDYAYESARRPTALRPAAALPPELPLVDGKVACTTCHDGTSPEPSRTALQLRELCGACHSR